MQEFPDPPQRGVYTRRDPTDGGRHVLVGYDDAGVKVLTFVVPNGFAAWGALKSSLEALLDLHGREDAGQIAPPQKASENENEHLRLVRTGDYSNTGEGFRIWELKHDVEGIAVFETRGVKGKPHAQAGDELWEEADSDLTPFKLKRDGRRIANPEWWMVEDLFKGLSAWHRESDDSEEDGEDADRCCHAPASTDRRYYSGTIEQSYNTGAYLFREALPKIGAEPGDVLIYAYNESDRPEEIYGRARGLAIEDYHAFRDAVRERHGTLRKGLPELLYNLSGPQGEALCGERRRRYTGGNYFAAVGAYEFLKDGKKWGANLKTFYSRLLLVKPWRRSVSEPIRAKSDEGAIFELLLELGCRPPTEDDDAGS